MRIKREKGDGRFIKQKFGSQGKEGNLEKTYVIKILIPGVCVGFWG